MSARNETEIQLMKILFRNQKKKPTKNLTSRRAYPHGVEQKYYRQLKGFFKPLTNYVKNYLDKNTESLLHGDSKEIKLDAIPGPSFRKMVYSLEDWLSIYMPDIADLPNDSNNNVILTALGKTADETMEFGEKEFKRILEQGIHVNMPTSASWWNDMKNSWMEDNYTLITSNAKKYISQINTLTEQAIVNGWSMGKLNQEIQKVTTGLSDKHCKLLARDQIGKLNGQINQAQMEELGLDLYVWSTAYDDRVRDSHSIMEGLLCRWDDANVCSYDNGKTWQDRPSGAVLLHPGQDIQCRCVGLAFYPELIAEMEGTSMQEQLGPDSEPVQDLPQFEENKLNNLPEYLRDNFEQLQKEFNFSGILDGDIETQMKNLVASGGINPHYEDSYWMRKGFRQYQYTENCQRCVPTLQMKMKGFDVTALPLPKKTPDYNDLMYGSNWYSWLKDKKGNLVKPTNVYTDMCSKSLLGNPTLNIDNVANHFVNLIKETPVGSMFEVRCSWKGGGGHVFSAFSVGEKGVIIYDPQTNMIHDLSWFKLMKPESIEFIRTDDKVIDVDRIKQACKNK